MTELESLYSRNREFASSFRDSRAPSRRGMSMVILTCVDARICPAHFFQLDEGEAFVIRKPGARVTVDVERDVAILAALASEGSQSDAPAVELVIVHHTDCAMESLAGEARRRELCARTGLDEHQLLALAIDDHAESLRADIARLRGSRVVPGAVVVSGHMYDVRTGALTQVVAPAALRAEGDAGRHGRHGR